MYSGKNAPNLTNLQTEIAYSRTFEIIIILKYMLDPTERQRAFAIGNKQF